MRDKKSARVGKMRMMSIVIDRRTAVDTKNEYADVYTLRKKKCGRTPDIH